MKRSVSFIVWLTMLVFGLLVPSQAMAQVMAVTGQAHVQNIGWMPSTSGVIGTTGRSLRLEAVKLSGPLTVQAHVQDIGWQQPINMQSGNYSGTVGRALRLEAVKITLNPYWDDHGERIEYRCHVQNIGWMSWVANGEVCGTTGRALRMEALEVRFVKADATPNPIQTNPNDNDTDTLIAVGDIGVEKEGLQNLTNIGQESADAVLLAGDLGYTVPASSFCKTYTSLISTPTVWVQGNHERPELNAIPGGSRSDYAACMPSLGNGKEGSEQVADVGSRSRVITASPVLVPDYEKGQAGYSRIATAVDKARVDGREPILMFHETCYSVGVHGCSGKASKDLSELAVAKGVKLVITAHDHNYSRYVSGNTTFVVVGNGGHKPRDLDSNSPYWNNTKVAFSGSESLGYLKVTIDHSKVVGELISQSSDSFEIRR